MSYTLNKKLLDLDGFYILSFCTGILYIMNLVKTNLSGGKTFFKRFYFLKIYNSKIIIMRLK